MHRSTWMKILIFSLTLLATLVYGQTPTPNQLFKAKSIKCTYGNGTVANWAILGSDGSPKLETALFAESKADCSVVFDSIDLEKGTARVIGNNGATDVSAKRTPQGVTFIEITPVGNVVIDTVFAKFKQGTSEFICVESRHNDGLSSPIPSQYHGTCKILE